jgi:alpha-tubulin suppressor-like RCC1 family protein
MYQQSAKYAFAVLKADGSVVTWGVSEFGGGISLFNIEVSRALTSGVRHIYSTEAAFAAVKEDGSVHTWGSEYAGGESDDVKKELSSSVRL